MENKNIQYVQLPSQGDISDISPQDQLVYLGIRSFMNKDTFEAFPSQKLVADLIGCCDKTVRASVKNLIEKDYLKIRKEGRKIIYTFNKLKQFEPFSYEFLKNRDYSFSEKALLASSQRYMFDKESYIGKVGYSKMELAQKINMSYPTVARLTASLQNKGALTLKNKVNELTNQKSQEMEFHFSKYDQLVVGMLLNHEDEIEELKKRISTLEAIIDKQNQPADIIL